MHEKKLRFFLIFATGHFGQRYTIFPHLEWCVVLVSIFFSFNLRNYMFQSAKKCEMTSFSMTSLHVDLNEAVKCVDIHCVHLVIETFGVSFKFNYPYQRVIYDNHAVNWVLIYDNVHIANLLIAPSRTSTKYEMATIFGLTYEDSLTNS